MSYVAKVEELSRTVWVKTSGAVDAREAYQVVTEERKGTRFATRSAAEGAARTYIRLQAPAVRRHMSYTVEEATKRGQQCAE